MENKEIYEKVEKEMEFMVAKCYEGVGMKINLRPAIMIFVTKAIRKTLDYKDTIQRNSEGGENGNML